MQEWRQSNMTMTIKRVNRTITPLRRLGQAQVCSIVTVVMLAFLPAF